ncbi:hypothetical protein C4D60_Mb11t18360 [Musa balbisiana]|uniref:Trichome birefringence-like C-terminal domain-containing protein n=1 Tax=Musa balbisiana TaxID=52838 RepID=A0A4V4H5M1_MUSBA|nr:hypothetical protein C4D60_Mb11t18360 [Musa balbisiana]
MEKPRSLSIRPTRLLLLASTVSSSLLFCFYFSFWLLENAPSGSNSAAYFQLVGGIKAVGSHPFTDSDSSLLDSATGIPIAAATHVSVIGNLSLEARGVGNEGKDEIFDDVQEREASDSSTEVPDSNDFGGGPDTFEDDNSTDLPDVNLKNSSGFSGEVLAAVAERIGRGSSEFNPVIMLELIRGKRLVFVGDSINRNQWESMLCMLRMALSDPTRVYEARGRRITKNRGNYNFKFPDYDCSLEYYVSHFLVRESKARLGQRRVMTLRIDTIDRSSSRWRGADILVFNSAHWWSHHKTKSGVNYYQEGNQVHPHLDVSTAFRKALLTWASWVDQHVIPGKTQVFFRSSAPSHFSGGKWNSGGHCKESIHPLNDTNVRQVPEKNVILEQVVKQMKTPVTVLNITNLSGLRIDGHPSVYGRNPSKGTPTSIQDCSHWCLPGVPDTWNELLYFYLLTSRLAQDGKLHV